MNPRRTIRRRSPWTWQRVLTIVLSIAAGLCVLALLRLFYVENTVLVPTSGGTYIEGSVGELQPLNPWFLTTNDVNRDIASLIFSGLQKYNPETKMIEDDLAEMEVNSDGTIYTLTLREGLEWHDSTPENPHFITVEDVLFTYQTIQDPEFPNILLHQNMQGVTIEEIDSMTVRFKLEEPYRFFPSNLTLGLLPKRSFEGISVSRLPMTIDFGLQPVGAGPYRFRSLVQTELSTEVTLERFPRPFGEQYHLESIVFRIFPDFPTLLSDLRNLQGVRLVPRNDEGEPLVPRRFRAVQYTLPQYVALFLNNDTSILQDPTLRLALQLGTNKQEVVDLIQESHIVDTPLLEIDVSDWRYQYDQLAAQGALFSSDWHLPEKVRLQRLLEKWEANSVGILNLDPIVYLDTGAVLTVTGSFTDVGSTGATLNDLSVSVDPNGSGSWIVALPTSGTGAIHIGENLIRLKDDTGDIVDSYYLWRSDDWNHFNRAAREQELLEVFVQSRDGALPPNKQITVMDLYLDRGMLRKRLSTDPMDIRVNGNKEKLVLRLLTSPSPPQYAEIAELIAQQWRRLGVHVGIDIPKTRDEFEEKLLTRDYDVVLFGQSLLDNLDSYPYWHSSATQKTTEDRNELLLDAYNLSQYSSLEADALLEFIRSTPNEDERNEALNQLREVLKVDVPAVFLYSPLYTFAYHQDLRGVELQNLSLHSDRFLTLHRWYMKEHRVFKPGVDWLSFIPWAFSLLF